MPAKDRYHEAFVRALEKNGWTITDDPLTLVLFGTDLLVDLGAERVMAAERKGERIAVGIKSFIKPSPVQDLKEALGQFMLYEQALRRIPANADRILYLAVRGTAYQSVFVEGIGRVLMDSHTLRLIVFDDTTEEISQWIP